MSNFTFIIGQIRALESKLLTKSQIDRMVGAQTPLDAFRVLIELQYSDYIDESIKPDDFENILEQGIRETRDRLIKGTNNDRNLEIIWGSADLNNLKRGFKLLFLKNEKSIEDFTSHNGFSSIGTLSKEEIETIVFHKTFPADFDDTLSAQILAVFSLWEKNKDMMEIEYILDKDYFQYFEKIADQSKEPFMKEAHQILINITNITSLARYILLRNKPMPLQAFIEDGMFQYSEFSNIHTADQFFTFLSSTKFSQYIHINPDHVAEESIMNIEKSLEQVYNKFLDEGQEGNINSIQVLISYFNRRIRNAKILKFIMFAKFNGLSSDVIYENLKTF